MKSVLIQTVTLTQGLKTTTHTLQFHYPVQSSDMSVNTVIQEDAFATVVINNDEPKVIEHLNRCLVVFHLSKSYRVNQLSDSLPTQVTIPNVLDPSS